MPNVADTTSNKFIHNVNSPLSISTTNNLTKTTNGTIFSPNLYNLLPLHLQQLYLQNLIQAGILNNNNLVENLLYQQFFDMQNNNFMNLLSETNSSSIRTNDNTNSTFVEFRARECGFCKSNKETREFYTSHYLKNSEGHVVCPILSKYVCPYCQATGIYAHTKGYCPKKPITEIGYNQFRNADKFVKTENFKFRNSCAEKPISGDSVFKYRVF